MPPRRYVDLQAGKAGTLLALELQCRRCAGPGRERPSDASNIVSAPVRSENSQERCAPFRSSKLHDVVRRREGAVPPGKELDYRGPQADGEQSRGWSGARRSAGGAPAPTPLKTANIEVRVDPIQEWKQMYREAWHTERDWFYDRNIHGLDLKEAEKKYEPYLRGVASRSDLTYLFQEMLGNITVSHMGTGGGDLPEVKRTQTGLLGADYEVANGRYRFARVYNGENWNPQLRAPLTQPGVNVKAGEYLLSVNGRDVQPPENVYSFFEELAGKSVLLRVGPDAGGAGSRDVTVVPVANETGLRNLAWIEDNRRKVDQMTGGKVAYIYMPDTSNGGLTAFNRYFYAQIGKDAAIVDERFNGGGLLATDIAEILNRKVLSAASNRVGDPLIQPQGIFGPKVMLINERAGSGGDAMPWYFRRPASGSSSEREPGAGLWAWPAGRV